MVLFGRDALPWEDNRCVYEDDDARCTGIRLGADRRCLAHTNDLESRKLALASVAEGGDLDFTPGVPLDEGLLAEILAHAPIKEGRPCLTKAAFSRAHFPGETHFGGATFHGAADFSYATFGGYAHFGGAIFDDSVSFWGATFHSVAGFDRVTFPSVSFQGATFNDFAGFEEAVVAGGAFTAATFQSTAHFGGATFGGTASFERSRFEAAAVFNGATFEGTASFSEARFGGIAAFRAKFGGNGDFHEANFGGVAGFDGARFDRDAIFRRATLERAQDFGPALALGSLVFDDAEFLSKIDIEVSASNLSCARAKFREGSNLRVRWAEVNFEETDFDSPTVLVQGRSASFDDSKLNEDQPDHPRRTVRPQVLSLRGANVGNLILSTVDLRACRFEQARNLDRLRFESDCEFARTPRRAARAAGGPPDRKANTRSAWYWTRRQVIAEEHKWRKSRFRSPPLVTDESLPRPIEAMERSVRRRLESARTRLHDRQRAGWYPQECQQPRWMSKAHPDMRASLAAEQIAGIYRALRKAREDGKDEPGAADFFYGEMDMRRAVAPRGECLLLWLYWLVSGYGLRASRALASLLATVLVFALLLRLWGFPPGASESVADAILYSAQSTTNLLRPVEHELTYAGQVLNVFLRLLGPLFFGLTLLSLRGRIKR